MPRTKLKPIQTEYKGYRFRSRLEARWAVFFDKLRIPFLYEPEGFDLDGEWYLPDFKCGIRKGCWIEIKATEPNKREHALARMLSKQSDGTVLILSGQPWLGEHEVHCYHSGNHTIRGFAWRCYWALIVTSLNFDGILIEAFALGIKRLIPRYMDRIQEAYQAARQARFEHGETPQ